MIFLTVLLTGKMLGFISQPRRIIRMVFRRGGSSAQRVEEITEITRRTTITQEPVRGSALFSII